MFFPLSSRQLRENDSRQAVSFHSAPYVVQSREKTKQKLNKKNPRLSFTLLPFSPFSSNCEKESPHALRKQKQKQGASFGKDLLFFFLPLFAFAASYSCFLWRLRRLHMRTWGSSGMMPHALRSVAQACKTGKLRSPTPGFSSLFILIFYMPLSFSSVFSVPSSQPILLFSCSLSFFPSSFNLRRRFDLVFRVRCSRSWLERSQKHD